MAEAFEIRPGLIGEYVETAPIPALPWLHIHAAAPPDSYELVTSWKDVGAAIEFCCHACAAGELVVFERYVGWPLVTHVCPRLPFFAAFVRHVERLITHHRDCAELGASIFDKLRRCPTERALVMTIDLRVPGAAAAVGA